MGHKRDYHIHTGLSNCANPAMTLGAIVRECERLGLEEIGIADHLYGIGPAPNANLRKEIEQLQSPLRVRLGIEAGFNGRLGTHPITVADKQKYGFDYAIGSHHSTYVKEHNLNRIIELQHEGHLKTCRHPAIDVLGHPWRFLYEEFRERGWPWFDTVTVVPKGLTRELGRVAKATGTAIEINATSNLCMKFNPPSYLVGYIDYLAILASEGVMFSLGSDAHELAELSTASQTWEVVDQLGLTDDRIWHPGLQLKTISEGT